MLSFPTMKPRFRRRSTLSCSRDAPGSFEPKRLEKMRSSRHASSPSRCGSHCVVLSARRPRNARARVSSLRSMDVDRAMSGTMRDVSEVFVELAIKARPCRSARRTIASEAISVLLGPRAARARVESAMRD